MVDLRRILVPVDFSPFSRRALDQAVAVARVHAGAITAVHVVPPALVPNTPFPYFTNPVLLDPDGADRIREELRRFVRPAAAAGVPVEADVREGSPWRRIVELTGSLPADLVVMGTHGRGGFERVVLGSVTEKVLRKASCPVMTVREAGHAPAPLFDRILCPIDFSAASLAAASHAASLAEASGGLLVLLNVLEIAPYGRFAYPEFVVPPDTAPQEERVRLAFRTAIPEEVRAWTRREERIVWGRPASEIVRVAREERADLVVMGVQGRGAIDLALFGSTTHEVVRHAACPVLTVRLAPAPSARKAAATEKEQVVLSR